MRTLIRWGPTRVLRAVCWTAAHLQTVWEMRAESPYWERAHQRTYPNIKVQQRGRNSPALKYCMQKLNKNWNKFTFIMTLNGTGFIYVPKIYIYRITAFDHRWDCDGCSWNVLVSLQLTGKCEPDTSYQNGVTLQRWWSRRWFEWGECQGKDILNYLWTIWTDCDFYCKVFF